VATELVDPFGLVGTKLEGQYRVDAVVGEGGFGVVYRGWHESLEQPIAIKALKVISADDPRVQEALFAKFKDEAKLLYTLSQASLHIVRSMDFGAVTTPAGHWAPYMILEWLAGRSMAEDLSERRKRGMRGRTLDEAFAILEPAAEGLQVAHARRVAHRDVKPANFFLLASQEGPRVKVLDFGIAKIVRDGEGPGTRSPFASFTWLYAAPEQLDPRVGQTGLETDVYGFALVLTELLTDRAPVEGRDVVTILKASTDPTVRPTPRQRGASVPDAVEHVCRRALAVDPKARFATVGELWAALVAARRASVAGPMSATPVTKPSEGSGAASPSMTGAPVPPSVAAMSVAAVSALPESPRVASGPPLGTAPPGYAPAAHGPTAPSGPTPPPFAPHAPPFAPHAPHAPAMPHPAMMSPPPMTAPPGTVHYAPRRIMPQASSAPIVLAILGLLLGLLFAGSCAILHAAC